MVVGCLLISLWQGLLIRVRIRMLSKSVLHGFSENLEVGQDSCLREE